MTSSLNPFLQKAYERYFANNNADMPENASSAEGTNVAKSLLNKQKWKMLKSIPGNNSGNTWNTMKLVNKGFSPLVKKAGVGSGLRGFAQSLRNSVRNVTPGRATAVGVGLGVPTVIGAAAYGANRAKQSLQNTAEGMIDKRLAPILNNVEGLTQQGQETLQNLNQQSQEVMQRTNQMLDKGNAFMQMGKDALRPWAGMSGHIGGGLAGMMGVQGFNRPQWLQQIIGFLKNLFRGQWLPGRTATASYFNQEGERDMTVQTPIADLRNTIFGSEQFHKWAEVGKDIPMSKPLRIRLWQGKW